jgi:heme-degrading monooxygenase HmoA
MIAVIFEVWPAQGRKDDYLGIAAALRADLDRIDGFISIERFQSLSHPEKLLSLSFWRDEEAVKNWRNHSKHRESQTKGRAGTTTLLAFEDITDRRAVEEQVQELLREKDMLLQEMQRRVSNSLQIIASILLMKARTVQSEETRLQLEDAHQRVLSVAAVQQHLDTARSRRVNRGWQLSFETMRNIGAVDDR